MQNLSSAFCFTRGVGIKIEATSQMTSVYSPRTRYNEPRFLPLTFLNSLSHPTGYVLLFPSLVMFDQQLNHIYVLSYVPLERSQPVTWPLTFHPIGAPAFARCCFFFFGTSIFTLSAAPLNGRSKKWGTEIGIVLYCNMMRGSSIVSCWILIVFVFIILYIVIVLIVEKRYGFCGFAVLLLFCTANV